MVRMVRSLADRTFQLCLQPQLRLLLARRPGRRVARQRLDARQEPRDGVANLAAHLVALDELDQARDEEERAVHELRPHLGRLFQN